MDLSSSGKSKSITRQADRSVINGICGSNVLQFCRPPERRAILSLNDNDNSSDEAPLQKSARQPLPLKPVLTTTRTGKSSIKRKAVKRGLDADVADQNMTRNGNDSEDDVDSLHSQDSLSNSEGYSPSPEEDFSQLQPDDLHREVSV